ncbi:MAG: hypothetical protein NVS2B3_05290 [Vulcanimicrobiaceae bacterium]
MRFGIRSGSTYTGSVKAALLFILATLSLMVTFGMILREVRLFDTLLRSARRKHGRLPIAFLANDVLFNIYALTTTILISVYALTDGELGLQGRYWFPVLVPTLAITIVSLPRILKARHRSRFSFFAALCWAIYAIFAAPSAIVARDRDYYGPQVRIPARELGEIQSVRDDIGTTFDEDSIRMTNARRLTLDGWTIDAERGLPARAMILRIDGRRDGFVRLGLPSVDVARTFNDPALARSDFRAVVDVDKLSCGRHTLDLAVVENRAPNGLAIARLSLTIARRGCETATKR